MANWNDSIIEEFHSNDGKVGGPFAGAHLLLLTTTGAKTGEKRTSPMMYFKDGERVFVIASKAGAPTSPAWYHNLVANPEVSVEQATASGIQTWDATATVVPRDERDALYAKAVEVAPNFGEYETKTTRVIPVVVLQQR